MKYGITREELERIGQLDGIDPGAALHRLHKYYCVPLRLDGLCSRRCVRDCGERVRKIIVTPGDNREATFTWACREANELISALGITHFRARAIANLESW